MQKPKGEIKMAKYNYPSNKWLENANRTETISQIARRLKIPQPNLYHHFWYHQIPMHIKMKRGSPLRVRICCACKQPKQLFVRGYTKTFGEGLYCTVCYSKFKLIPHYDLDLQRQRAILKLGTLKGNIMENETATNIEESYRQHFNAAGQPISEPVVRTKRIRILPTVKNRPKARTRKQKKFVLKKLRAYIADTHNTKIVIYDFARWLGAKSASTTWRIAIRVKELAKDGKLKLISKSPLVVRLIAGQTHHPIYHKRLSTDEFRQRISKGMKKRWQEIKEQQAQAHIHKFEPKVTVAYICSCGATADIKE
jgi:hypothetical protein